MEKRLERYPLLDTSLKGEWWYLPEDLEDRVVRGRTAECTVLKER